MTPGSQFEGKLYRALNPVWAAQPLSGEGAARHGGRFNPRGLGALYCSLDPLTILREANQVGDLQPTLLVAVDAGIENVFDARLDFGLAALGMTFEDLVDAGWRDAMLRSRAARRSRTSIWSCGAGAIGRRTVSRSSMTRSG